MCLFCQCSNKHHYHQANHDHNAHYRSYSGSNCAGTGTDHNPPGNNQHR